MPHPLVAWVLEAACPAGRMSATHSPPQLDTSCWFCEVEKIGSKTVELIGRFTTNVSVRYWREADMPITRHS